MVLFMNDIPWVLSERIFNKTHALSVRNFRGESVFGFKYRFVFPGENVKGISNLFEILSTTSDFPGTFDVVVCPLSSGGLSN